MSFQFVSTKTPFQKLFLNMFGLEIFKTKKNYTNPWAVTLEDKTGQWCLCICRYFADVQEFTKEAPLLNNFVMRSISTVGDMHLAQDKMSELRRFNTRLGITGYCIVKDDDNGDAVIVTLSEDSLVFLYLNVNQVIEHDRHLSENKKYFGGMERYGTTYLGLSHKTIVSSPRTDLMYSVAIPGHKYLAHFNPDNDTLYLRSSYVHFGNAKSNVYALINTVALALAHHTHAMPNYFANVPSILEIIADILTDSYKSYSAGSDKETFKVVRYNTLVIVVAVYSGGPLEILITDARNQAHICDSLLFL